MGSALSRLNGHALAAKPFPFGAMPLQKILALEEHKGFEDNAVSGGIRRFIERWETELREHSGPHDPDRIATQLVSAPYRELAAGTARRQWVAAWRTALWPVQGRRHPCPDPQIPLHRQHRTVDGTHLSIQPPETPPIRPNAAAYPSRTCTPHGGSTSHHARTRGRTRPTPTSPSRPFRRMDAHQNHPGGSRPWAPATVRELLYMLPTTLRRPRPTITNVADIYAGGTFTLEGDLVEYPLRQRRPTPVAIGRGDISRRHRYHRLAVVRAGFSCPQLCEPAAPWLCTARPRLNRGRLTIQSPEYDVVTESAPPLNAGRITPVYRLTQGMTARNPAEHHLARPGTLSGRRRGNHARRHPGADPAVVGLQPGH